MRWDIKLENRSWRGGLVDPGPNVWNSCAAVSLIKSEYDRNVTLKALG